MDIIPEFIELPGTLPILPLRNKVFLPLSVIRVALASTQSIALVEKALLPNSEQLIGVVPVKEKSDTSADTISTTERPFHMHSYGVAATILQLSRTELPRRSYTLLLEGKCRFKVRDLCRETPYLEANVLQVDMLREVVVSLAADAEINELARSFKDRVLKLIKLVEPSMSSGEGGPSGAGRVKAVGRLKAILDRAPPHSLADLFSSSFEPMLTREHKLQLLNTECSKKRLAVAISIIDQSMQRAEVSKDINQKVDATLSKSQREFLLRQQLKAIKDELGEGDAPGEDDEVGKLEKRLQEASLPDEVGQVVEAELRKLRRYNEQQPGYQSLRDNLEWIADLPWNKTAAIDEASAPALPHARQILDRDHYGLDKIKQRLLEYLAVRQLKEDGRPPVLCFVGPPGVGKTSLAKSIAGALQRPLQRIALGGVRDEADIRGHRRTYIGSMPGRIIQGLKRAGVNDAVFLLDEIDKMGSDSRGDPTAALLEVLDPEQNTHFTDHYLNVPFDLSKITFIATANDLRGISAPLRDRLEVVSLGGYTYEEKHHIARTYLFPRQLKEHGLQAAQLELPDDMLDYIISSYTREAGVRLLEKRLAALCRAVAVVVVEARSDDHHGEETSPRIRVDRELVEKVLGPCMFEPTEVSDRITTPGIVAGLVWTSVGGEVQFIECTTMPGTGKLILTGQLGDVIKESAQIALSWVRGHSSKLGLGNKAMHLEKEDLHIHFPAGAVPKDGPSAGVTMACALVSFLSGACMPDDIAMTGELTLHGHVLPVGGIKEKMIAAQRAGLKRVFIPARNMSDVTHEVPKSVKNTLEIIPVKRAEEVLTHLWDLQFSHPEAKL